MHLSLSQRWPRWRSVRRNLYFLYQRTKARFLQRHESSFLGVLWYLLGPVLMFTVLMVVFSQRLGATIDNYILYLLSGIVLWNFFNAATSNCLGSLMGQVGLIKNLPVRSDVLVLSSVIDAFINHLFELIIVIVLTVFFGTISPLSPLIVFVVALNFLFVLGMGYLLSALFFIFRDLNQIWSILLRIWWFSTPIFYQLTPTGPGHKISMFNPMFHIIDIGRDFLIYQRMPSLQSVLFLAVSAGGAFLLGYYTFRKFAPHFPEYV